jgi:hypothetical protein
MAGSWFDSGGMVETMNAMFVRGSALSDTANKFKQKHGNNGHGGGGKPPYKFGGFAVGVQDAHGKKPVPTNREAKWLIDTGTRHFDAGSIQLIEAAVLDSLAQPPGQEKQITFRAGQILNPGDQARVHVQRTGPGDTGDYIIIIDCAP